MAVAVLGVLSLTIAYGYALEPFASNSEVPDWYFGLFVLDIGLGAVAIGLYPFRARSPLLVTVLIVAICAVSQLAAAAAVFAVVSLATRRRWREMMVICPVFVAAVFVNDLVLPIPDSSSWWQLLALIVVLLSVMVLSGLYIGGRRQLQASLEQQLAGTRREQAALLDSAKVGERARIAREMHDVLAHRLSLVALHSGALEFRTDLDPAESRATAGVIRDNAHHALTELREVLGVLREEADTFEPAPQPTLASLSSLLEDSRAAGNAITLDLDSALAAELAELPDTTSRHLYRVIQEALTNARRHAPAEPVRVRLHGRRGRQVGVAVSNRMAEYPAPTRQPTSGLGLVGLHERVRLAGGHLVAGQDDDRWFRVKAELPWQR